MKKRARLPAVTSVEVPRHHVIRVRFDDGAVRELRFEPGTAQGSLLAPLNDADYFAQVTVDPGARTVVWPNGLDLDPVVLHGDAKPVSDCGFKDITPRRSRQLA
jgi:hypothetical protein